MTGWPQTDLLHRRRPREEYDGLLRAYGLDPARPSCSSPGTPRAMRPTRGASSSASSSGGSGSRAGRVQLLFRPHPRDRRMARAVQRCDGAGGEAVQEPSYTDLEELATLLQHVDVVVCNAGTILLDALVGDRPAVCVLYDEGAPAGESWAAKNVVGKHYDELAASGAFYRADQFDEVVAGIVRALERPEELAEARRGLSPTSSGVVDGQAAARVVDAVTESSGSVAHEARDDLLARDEADIVDAQIAFHLHAGVDFVIATDNRVERRDDRDPRALRACGLSAASPRAGRRHAAGQWVTRMARLAATEHGADWVINSDADEFWWPRRLVEGGSRDGARPLRRRARMLAPLPPADRRRLVLRGADDRPPRAPAHSGRQADDHLRTRRSPTVRGPTSRSSAATQRRRAGPRAAARLASDRGPALLVALRGAAGAQGARRLDAQPGVRRAAPPAAPPGGVRDRAGRRPLRRARGRRRRLSSAGLAGGTLAVDTRLRDALRACVAQTGRSPFPGTGRRLAFPRPTAAEDAGYAAEAVRAREIDGVVAPRSGPSRSSGRIAALEEARRRRAGPDCGA